MKYPKEIRGIVWLIIGILFCLWSIHSYKIGSLTKPGAGFFPFFLSILMILLSLILLKQHPKSSPLTFGGLKKVTFTILILLIGALFFERVGYLITIFLSIILLMGGVEPRGWKRILSVAFLSTLAIYIVFVLLLGQPLPRGFMKF
jgi:putative tricarboxylic transport membrane protein